MEEVSKAITLTFIAIIGALLTQILLRWDQTRRDTRLRLLEGIRIEQALFERVAYKARHLILDELAHKDAKSAVKIDEALFGDVYRESRLVTLCAELYSYGIPYKEYADRAHNFREACLNIVNDAIDGKGSKDSVEKVISEIKDMSAETKRMTQKIHHRFSWP
jgi:hypothetical protein